MDFRVEGSDSSTRHFAETVENEARPEKKKAERKRKWAERFI
eukprot:CAMPEP_0171778616 /NCGR_PEP_ID=MMETSP0991-20121206/58513_1 /TAXON_ID=483369 /ORGANISM="non described non described, Strain CCMP2098" /LENGTH=41 /DNA_ID= /DNA_START= /DNA_END= /DNA_ORIENTATION=